MDIQDIIPQALQTLVHPTPPAPETISEAERWLSSGGWGLTGKETPDEINALTEAYQESVRWLASFIDGLDPYWLVMVGASGTGKTMLCKRIASYLNQFGVNIFNKNIRNKMGAFTQDTDAIYSYRQEGGALVEWRNTVPHSETNQRIYKKAQRDWFKVIDDLKAQTGEAVRIKVNPDDKEATEGVQPKRFEVSAAGDLLDARLRKWTVINSNLTRKQLAVFWDVRIASRLTRDGNTIVDLSNVRDFCFRAKN